MKESLRRAVYVGMRGSGTLALKRQWLVRSGRGWGAVLVFHRVSDVVPESGISLSPARFRSTLELLRRSYQALTASDFVAHLEEKRPFTGREILITFDDGYADNYEIAAPILHELNVPAIFFLTAGYIGTPHDFWWDRDAGVRSDIMSWDQARGLAELGFEIGCHTMTHPDLGREPVANWQKELVQSRRMLEDRLGVPVTHFAYPYGARQNIRLDWLDRIRLAGFRSSFCGFGGLATCQDDPFWIPRMGAAHQRTVVDLRIEIDNAW